MTHSAVRSGLEHCEELKGLDVDIMARLLWFGEEQSCANGDVVYQAGTPCDDSIAILLDGELSDPGHPERRVTPFHLFGEAAFFERNRQRSVTLAVTSPRAVVFRIRIDPAHWSQPHLEALMKRLAPIASVNLVASSR